MDSTVLNLNGPSVFFHTSFTPLERIFHLCNSQNFAFVMVSHVDRYKKKMNLTHKFMIWTPKKYEISNEQSKKLAYLCGNWTSLVAYFRIWPQVLDEERVHLFTLSPRRCFCFLILMPLEGLTLQGGKWIWKLSLGVIMHVLIWSYLVDSISNSQAFWANIQCNLRPFLILILETIDPQPNLGLCHWSTRNIPFNKHLANVLKGWRITAF